MSRGDVVVMAKKPASWTTKEVGKRLFPPEVRKWIKEQLAEAAKPKKRTRKTKKSSAQG
jgi:hypothetical protein